MAGPELRRRSAGSGPHHLGAVPWRRNRIRAVVPAVELVNVTVCAGAQPLSGTPRLLAIVPGLALRCRLIPDPDHGRLGNMKTERWRPYCQPAVKVAQVRTYHTTRR